MPKAEVTTPAPCRVGGQGAKLGTGPGRVALPLPTQRVFTKGTVLQATLPHVVPVSSLTFWGLRHGGAQAVHVVTPIAVITKQQLVLGGETRPAGTLGARAPETGVGGWGRG